MYFFVNVNFFAGRCLFFLDHVFPWGISYLVCKARNRPFCSTFEFSLIWRANIWIYSRASVIPLGIFFFESQPYHSFFVKQTTLKEMTQGLKWERITP